MNRSVKRFPDILMVISVAVLVVSAYFAVQELLGRAGTLKVTKLTVPSVLQNLESVGFIIKKLDNAKEGETIILTVDGFGGSIMGGVSLMSAIHTSKAIVKVKVYHAVHSVYAFLVCVADEVLMLEGSYLMFHTFQKVSPQGSLTPIVGKNMAQDLLLTRKYIERRCEKYLSSEELSLIFDKGKEIHIDSNQVHYTH